MPNTSDVPAIVEDMAPYRRWIDPLLHDAYATGRRGKRPSQATPRQPCPVAVDATQVNYLYGRLLDAEAARSCRDP